ncbi:MAG: hypothetical protein AB1742_04320 [bacterium]
MIGFAVYKHLLTLRLPGAPEVVVPYQYCEDGEARFADSVEVDFPVVTALFGESAVVDRFQYSDGLLTVRRKWNLKAAADVRLQFTVLVRLVPAAWMVPSVMYDGNGFFPEAKRKGTESGLSFLEDRASVPAASFVRDGESYFALFAGPAPAPDQVGSVYTFSEGEFTELTVFVPGSETPPYRGLRLPGLLPRTERKAYWSVDGLLTMERGFYLAHGAAAPSSARDFIEKAWETLSIPPRLEVDWSRYVDEKILHLVHHFFIERADAIGFVETISRSLFPLKAVLNGGLRGGNLEAALALYRAAVESGSRPLKRIALDVADFFLAGGEQPGAFRTSYRLGARRWTCGNDAKPHPLFLRCVSEVAAFYVRFHSRTKESRDHNPRWMLYARNAAELLVRNQMKSGAFRVVPPHEHPDDEQGSLQTAFAAHFLVEFYRETGAQECLEAARLAGAFLLEEARRRMYSDPSLGAGEPSRAAAHACLRAFLSLHDETGEKSCLDAAVGAAEFLLSGVFCYDAAFSATSPLGKMGFRTQGGTCGYTSCQHLDWYGVALCPDLLRLWKLTGDETWKRAVTAILEFTTQARGQDTGGAFWEALPGYQPEVLMQTGTRHTLSGHVSRGGYAGIASWVPVTIVSSLLDIRELFPGVVSFTMPPLSLDPPSKSFIGKTLFHVGSYVNVFR